MSRQRRMDAIARRRAFIDTQIQLLSSNEARVPNIIRSRTGRSVQRPRYTPSTPTLYYQQEQPGTHVGTGGGGGYSVVTGESTAGTAPQAAGMIFTGGTNSSNVEQMYVTVVSTGESGEGQTESIVPISITDDEIAKFLASTSPSSGEELMSSLQTIQTEDGTVMVVLEGGELNEERLAQTREEDNLNSSSSAVASATAVEGTSAGDVDISGVKVECDSPGAPPPSSLSTYSEEEQVPVMEMDGESESYVILETPEGEVLVPTSYYQSQSQPTPPVPLTPSIVEFVASEGGAIEQMIRTKSAKSVAKRPRHTLSSNRLESTRSSPLNAKSQAINKAKSITKKQTYSSFNSASHANESTLSSFIPPVDTGEKPRPFRFELPEFENDLNDNFLTVPVPIKIDSLRSETVHKVDITTASKQCQMLINGAVQSGAVLGGLSQENSPESASFGVDSTELHLESLESTDSKAEITLESGSSHAHIMNSTYEGKETVSLTENQLILQSSQSVGEKSEEDGETVYIQFVEANEQLLKSANGIGVIDDSTNTFVILDTIQPVGRRTLNKATAKADMSNEPFSSSSSRPWNCESEKETVTVQLGPGQTATIQSARIRARNDRIKALDQNFTTEDTIGDNFRNIFEKVVKQGVGF